MTTFRSTLADFLYGIRAGSAVRHGHRPPPRERDDDRGDERQGPAWNAADEKAFRQYSAGSPESRRQARPCT